MGITRLGERGASSVEYALLMTLIAVFIIGGVGLFGQAVANLLNVTWP
jgi:Flp pilus assembly pilin Flp